MYQDLRVFFNLGAPQHMKSFTTYLKNVRAELTHVVWPSQEQALQHVALIILISIATALFIAGIDYLFTTAAGQFI